MNYTGNYGDLETKSVMTDAENETLVADGSSFITLKISKYCVEILSKIIGMPDLSS